MSRSVKYLAMLTCLLTLISSAEFCTAHCSGGSNAVYLEEVWQANGKVFSYPINLQNQVELSRLVVPLHLSPPADLVIDSIAFTSTRLEGLGSTSTWFDNLSDQLWIDFTADPAVPLGTGDGVVAYVFFTTDQNALAADIEVDTLFIAPDKEFYLENDAGVPVSALFLAGLIHIVTQVPIIDLDPEAFIFETVENVDPPPQRLNVYNIGIDPLNWHISSKPPWLLVSQEEGTAPSEVFLAPEVAGLPLGSYYDSVAVTDSLSANHTLWATIELRIVEAPLGGLSGWVWDTLETAVAGAAVEIWDSWPVGAVVEATVSAADGSFAFPDLSAGDYDLYVYRTGYYPSLLPITAPADSVIVRLTPASDPPAGDEWIVLQCEENYHQENLLPIGSVVEAYDQSDVCCGQFFVHTVGAYGPMAVYRDNPATPGDEGADVGELLELRINGTPAVSWPPPAWTHHLDEQYVCLNTTDVDTVCIDLDAGWNLISWNVDTYFDEVEILIADIAVCVDVILGFEYGSATYDPDLEQFSTLDYLDHYHGYWFRMDCPAQLCLTGVPVNPVTPITLEANWNLVSYLPAAAQATENSLGSVIADLVVALGYDGGGLTYETAHTELATLLQLEPKFGYWLKTTGATTLSYPAGLLKSTAKDVAAGTMKPRPVAAGVHPTPEWVDVYGDQLTLDGALLSAGTLIQFYDEAGNLCGASELQSTGTLPFTSIYRDDAQTPLDEGADRGSEIAIAVNGVQVEEGFGWTGWGERIELQGFTSSNKSDRALPLRFELSQNFPNPFNPATVINFSVPIATTAKIEVFNLLGEKVKTIISRHLPAGSYQVSWDGTLSDGTCAPSALYFYRLTAGEVTMSRKMLLVK